ncbi:MAG: SH3 domain-containing protein [Chloroflexi bacterium]|nr:SH3 domain-containing protein [Chloroflexota bacterium]
MDRRNLEREKLLFRYSAALERGDFDTAAEVLRAAERDPALEAMLLDLNAASAASCTAYGAMGGAAGIDAPNVQINVERSNVMVTALPARPASRNVVSWFSLAAVVTVVLFGALILNRAPMSGNDPSTGVVLGGANDGLQQSPGSVECPAVVSSAEGASLISRPDANAPAVGSLADGAQVRVIEVIDAPAAASPEPERWAYVVASDGSGQGWVNSRLLRSSAETCPLLFAPPSLPATAVRSDVLPPTDSGATSRPGARDRSRGD